jgi:tetratricopeptide (TPR) repeat protein
MKKISVFIASPSDLPREREIFRKTIDQLNIGFWDSTEVKFESLGWEDTLTSAGCRNQTAINQEIDRCDLFVLVIHKRWGLDIPDKQPSSSYTENEFHLALERWKKERKPKILVFFKRINPESEADPGPQLLRVIEFKKLLEETRQILFFNFSDENSFAEVIDYNLRAYAKGELPEPGASKDTTAFNLRALKDVKEAKEFAAQKMKKAIEANETEKELLLKTEIMQLQLAEEVANLSSEGKVEFARQKLAEVVAETRSFQIFPLAFEFYYQTGDLYAAFDVSERWLRLSGMDKKSPETAIAYSNLGILYYGQGELDSAEEVYQKSLAINEALNHQERIASDCSNLGVLYKTKGDLNRAKEMYLKSLTINEALGRKEVIASDYVNLGNLYRKQNDLDRAEEMYRKSFRIFSELGSPLAEKIGSLLDRFVTDEKGKNQYLS